MEEIALSFENPEHFVSGPCHGYFKSLLLFFDFSAFPITLDSYYEQVECYINLYCR